jgi:ABC-2 type transport system ATP-binding protein
LHWQAAGAPFAPEGGRAIVATVTQPPPRSPALRAEEERGPWSPEAAIEVRGAGKRFDETWVVRNLDFTVERGSIFGIFGPSGSGKTTTIRLLLGLLGADEGEIRVLGTSPRRFKSRTRARIGYMPQLFVLYPEHSVMENLSLVASLYGLGWLKRRKPMRRILEFVELWDHRRKTASELSGGMKRRLELATALVHTPDLIVVDEPTAGVDPILRSKFWEHFHELRDEGRTIFVTSQYVTEAQYCDNVAFLGRGELVAVGTPEEVRKQAVGGEIVEVLAGNLDDRHIRLLGSLDGVAVKRIRRVYDDQGLLARLQLTVDEAGQAVPRILAALGDSGAEVQQVEEYRPNFDEIFVLLMEHSHVASVD